MFSTGTIFENEKNMTLQAAVMLYGDNNGAAFATAHNVAYDQKGVPVLCEGHPMTVGILNSLTAALAKGAESKRSFNGYLPETVLAVGLSSIVWWLPASDRSVGFACSDKLIGNRIGKTPHPPLVFGVRNDGRWSVFALKENVRPTPETKLWQAPYFNVWTSGQICQGTTQVPPGAAVSQVEGWNKSFFTSNFSHANIHDVGKLVSYKGGPYRFWRDMLDGKFKKFPMRVLVETEYTLDDFINATLNGGEL
jgi:PRTRC genetic system protein B